MLFIKKETLWEEKLKDKKCEYCQSSLFYHSFQLEMSLKWDGMAKFDCNNAFIKIIMFEKTRDIIICTEMYAMYNNAKSGLFLNRIM